MIRSFGKIPSGKRLSAMTALLLFAVPASADPWELRPAAGDVPGSPELESGRIDEAIRVLSRELDSVTGLARLGVLENLCVAYAMQREYDAAMRYCNRAAGHEAANARTLNNRGVVRAVTGDYRGAIQDFRRSACLPDCGSGCDAGSVRDMVQRNLGRAIDRESPARSGREEMRCGSARPGNTNINSGVEHDQ